MIDAREQTFVHAHTAVIAPAILKGKIDWTEGPLPDGHNNIVADRRARSPYFYPNAANQLYGGDEPRRWHIRASASSARHLHAVEIYKPFDNYGFVVGHYRLGQTDGLSLIERDYVSLAHIMKLLPEGVIVDEEVRRTMTLTVCFPATPLERFLPEQYELWSAHEQWLWAITSGRTLTEFPPDPTDRSHMEEGLVSLSADWAALVLRDGIGFVGTGSSFASHGQWYGSTIYLDAALLGETQRAMVLDFTVRMIETDPQKSPNLVIKLERDFARLRAMNWWTEVTPGLHARRILRRYQTRHHLGESIGRLSLELGDAARRVQTVAAERTNAYLALFAILGAPVGAALQIAELFGWTKQRELALLAIATASVVIALAVSPVGRPLFRYIRIK